MTHFEFSLVTPASSVADGITMMYINGGMMKVNMVIELASRRYGHDFLISNCNILSPSNMLLAKLWIFEVVFLQSCYQKLLHADFVCTIGFKIELASKNLCVSGHTWHPPDP